MPITQSIDLARKETIGKDGVAPDVLADADCGSGPGSCGGPDLATLGRGVAERRQCVACHTFDGQPHVGPTWSGLYGSTRTLADGRA